MKILVCIKQVPDMESKFKIDGAGTWYDGADLALRMNEYDEYAVEQAVQVKELVGDADLTILCIGSKKVQETMKKGNIHLQGAELDDSLIPRDIAEILAERLWKLFIWHRCPENMDIARGGK